MHSWDHPLIGVSLPGPVVPALQWPPLGEFHAWSHLAGADTYVNPLTRCWITLYYGIVHSAACGVSSSQQHCKSATHAVQWPLDDDAAYYEPAATETSLCGFTRCFVQSSYCSRPKRPACTRASARMLLSGGDASREGVMGGRRGGMFNVPELP